MGPARGLSWAAGVPPVKCASPGRKAAAAVAAPPERESALCPYRGKRGSMKGTSGRGGARRGALGRPLRGRTSLPLTLPPPGHGLRYAAEGVQFLRSFVKETRTSESGAELVQPGGFSIVLRKKRASDPPRIAGLQKLENEYPSPPDLADPDDVDLPGWADMEGPRTVRASPETLR